MSVPCSKTMDYRKTGRAEPVRRPRPYHSPVNNRGAELPETQTVTYLFSDIEGSTRLWETDPDGAARALAWHDRLSRDVVERHHGVVVKMTGDGMHAAFADPAAAVDAVIDLQTALARTAEGVPALKVRCGLHLGADQRRDNDFYGPAVNRAARISGAAHGGQILLSGAVAERVGNALPAGVQLRELGQVRLRDLSSPERLFQLVHPSLRSEFPALRSLASTPNNLPQQLNSFVGREREVGEVRALLAKNRLVTLLAMGGIGKSRLSIQLGAEVLEDYPDGVWLIELAPIADPADVPQAMAAALGVKEEPGGGVVEALTRFVRDRTLLLIIDNCEHVVRGAADLAKRLLQASPGLKVLASSRDPLQIAGETVYYLQTLAVPSADDVRPEDLAQRAAVQLFLDRAVAAQPSFHLTDKVAGPVAEICRRLDGIPLALELAAARTRSLPVDAIAARLDQRFKLLTTGDQTVLPRQRTLRALIDWSYDLLDERDRAAFRRLAVFAGGWTLEAAEAVVAGDDIATDEVLDLLASLVEKSLVVMEADSGRYRMLDTVRHYAAEKLAESGDGTATRGRHCLHFVDVAERARAALGTAEQTNRLRGLDADRDNLLAAYAATGEAVDGDAVAFRLMQALRFYLIHRGMPSAVLSMCQELLRRTGLAGRTLLRCRTLFGAGQACQFLARYAEARAYLDESLAIARELGDQARIAATLQPLGVALIGEGRYDVARAYVDEAVALAMEFGTQREQIGALNLLGMLHRVQMELGAAEDTYRRALTIARSRPEDEESVGVVLLNLVMTKVLQRDHESARAMLCEVVDIAARTGSVAVQQSAIEVFVGLAASEGNWQAAGRLYGFIEAQALRTGLRRDPADDAFVVACLERARQAAGTSFAGLEREGRALRPEQAMDEVRASLAAAPAATTSR